MNIKKHIPNFLTLCNVASGSYGIILIFQGDLITASYMVWVAAFFDFLDGLAARLLKVSSEIGKELDSMADMVSFGALPGFFMYSLLNSTGQSTYLPLVAILIIAFSALRLAKFNIDTRQSEVFIGLPTPANAIFITSLIHLESLDLFSNWILSIPSLITLTILFSLLMVSELELMSLKFKTFGLKNNLTRYGLILMSVILLLIWNMAGISLIIVGYILFSFVLNISRTTTA